MIRRAVLVTAAGFALTVPVTSLATAAPVHKQGSDCIGADIGRKAVSPSGVPLVCDMYTWQRDHGQKPRHWQSDL